MPSSVLTGVPKPLTIQGKLCFTDPVSGAMESATIAQEYTLNKTGNGGCCGRRGQCYKKVPGSSAAVPIPVEVYSSPLRPLTQQQRNQGTVGCN
jgi:hypothetical protein